jgi:hypothetical protein
MNQHSAAPGRWLCAMPIGRTHLRAYRKLAATSRAAEPASGTGQILNQTTGVRAAASAVSVARATQQPGSGPVDPDAERGIRAAGRGHRDHHRGHPHMVNASASHSCKTMRRLALLIGAKPARTQPVGTACATPHSATTAAAT